MHTSERKLLWAFFISVSINIIACAFYVYEWQEGLFPFVRIAGQKAASFPEERPNMAVTEKLVLLRGLPQDMLFPLLQDKAEISDGYLARDCALAILFSFYHLDVERALDGLSLQKRRLALPAQESIILFAALGDSDYEKIVHFIEKERFPFTPEGLFLLLQKTPQDASLALAFMRTEEYTEAKMCLTRNSKIAPELAHELILHGSWQEIAKLATYKMAPDVAHRLARRSYIAQLAAKKPELATEALVLADLPFALQSLHDEQILFILPRLKDRPDIAKQFACALLQRPRSDRVWKAAAETFCALEKLPPEYADRKKLLDYLRGQTKEVKKPVKKSPPKPTSIKKQSSVFHVVQKGDSLWSIAKKYSISIDQLRAANRLRSDSLKPGTKLLIPQAKA
jgi:hypothetical protein